MTSPISPRSEYRALLGGASLTGPAASFEPLPNPPGDLASFEARLASLREEEEHRFLPVPAERALLAYAPTGLLEGCWLTSSADVRVSHEEAGQAALQALFLECGSGDTALHRGNLYRAHLASLGLSVPAPHALATREDPRWHEDDFALALVGLRLGLCPVGGLPDGGLRPEIFGFHAASVALGPPAVVRRGLAASGPYLADRSPGTPGFQRAWAAACRCMESLGVEMPWLRLWRGASLLVESRRRWEASLHRDPPGSPWERCAALVQRKARHARGRHGALTLGGRRLDEWFADAESDADGFLLALARSPWVTPGKPKQSPLVTSAVRFGGPMFGVFSAEELDLLGAWIASLPQAPARTSKRAFYLPVEQAPPQAAGRFRTPSLSLPSLYGRLLRREADHEVQGLARTHLCRSLEGAARGASLAWRRGQGLVSWSREGLARWLDARMKDQLGPSGPVDLGAARLLSREQVLWLLLQLAPAALVDGAWLQGMTSARHFLRPEAGLLQKIYLDELGNGISLQHHGNVMRRTLEAQGVALPPCDSEALRSRPEILPQAYAMPVLWLSFARGGDEFFPELLGLNLAIEMAGLGSTYALASALLRRHGIDPYFFQLHETIDNPASGHTAWSAEVIHIHMENTYEPGSPEQARGWERIWRGYAVYERTSRPLVLAVARALGPGLAWGWLRALATGNRSEARGS